LNGGSLSPSITMARPDVRSWHNRAALATGQPVRLLV
jgi:hypothetical protein